MSSINFVFTLRNLAAAAPGGRPYRAFSCSFQAVLCAVLILSCAARAGARPLQVLAFGDSLTAGYGLAAQDAFPAQLERRLRADGFDASVTNAGVSGETSADGLARLDFSLQPGTDLVILELGANDMLRGLPPKAARENLEKMVDAIRARGAQVLLAGMKAEANFGPDYKAQFDAIFPELAKERSLRLYPFFLEGVAGDQALVQSDGLHPNPKGVARVVAGIAPLVEECLRRGGGKPTSDLRR